MIWPPQSPDCNPIELLWDELDRRVRKTKAANINQLWKNLKVVWESIPAETLEELTSRMPRICQAVINAKRGSFEESRI
ncbi:hypothetical protein ILUMI_20683 [Ignelater luminosus]|uniref:Tc1-like transposase DDE domain-containing protein n=1 Tax=Ignelater luminosus TaxID=2038154 RepID=A0A8K0CDX8_IGNLU|nr:hypothetical protein ILUMI_20683 [Ignelater luminosus]